MLLTFNDPFYHLICLLIKKINAAKGQLYVVIKKPKYYTLSEFKNFKIIFFRQTIQMDTKFSEMSATASKAGTPFFEVQTENRQFKELTKG